MKNLITVFILLILCNCVTTQSRFIPKSCVPRSIYFMERNKNSVAILGRTKNNVLHCEAVEIIYLTADSYVYIPLDGNNTIIKIIPNNKDREYFTLDEVKKARWNPANR